MSGSAPAEVLRRAAAQIRNDHGGAVSRNTRDGRRWLPVADWLDSVARAERDEINGADIHHALVVARAYLDES